MSKARGKAKTDRIAAQRDDWNRSRQLRDGGGRAPKCRDQVRLCGDRRRGELGQPRLAAVGIAVIDDEIAALFVPEFAQTGLVPLEGIPAAARRPEPEKDDMRHPALRIGEPR